MTNEELLNKTKEIRDKIRKRSGFKVPKINKVRMVRQNNFTVAILNNKHIGVSKRNPCDSDTPEIAASLAIHRALENAVER